MADTTSIASRMEKLAKLKRMKEGLTSEPAVSAEGAVQTEASDPVFPEEAVFSDAAAGFEQPSVPEEVEISGSEEVQQSPIATDVEGAAGDQQDSDLKDVWNEDLFAETSSSDAVAPIDEIAPTADVDFVMGHSAAPTNIRADETDLDNNAPSLQATHEEDHSSKDANGLSASTLGIDEETQADFDEIAAVAGAGGVAAAVATSASEDDKRQDSSDVQMPDFSANEVDSEVLEREFENEFAAAAPAEKTKAVSSGRSPIADEDSEGRISVSFDESRSTLLNHVSRQMGCSVEDVVVTALDWYLDALFGEEDEAKSA